MRIKSLSARQILDSKGDPTLQVKVELDDGTTATAGVPAGASTGKNEALELRDNGGKGVAKAVENVNIKIAAALENKSSDQAVIDKTMIDLDGTSNKSNLGANAIVGVSMAVCRLAAKARKIELYDYLGELSGNRQFVIPQPLVLVMEGGKHGEWATDIQEFLVIPKKEKFNNLNAMFEAGRQVFYALELVLKEKGYGVDLGLEGGYCPKVESNQEALVLISQAVKRAGFVLGEEIVLGLDCAASEFFADGHYEIKSRSGLKLTSAEWAKALGSWLEAYPLWSLEDPFDQEDWPAWQAFNRQFGQKIQVVADDLTVTNVSRIKKAAELQACRAVIIKPNQIGTLTETFEAVKAVKSAGWQAIVSHRGGETMDDFIADLAVGTNCPQCKFGGPTKPERVAKYNRMMEIEKLISK